MKRYEETTLQRLSRIEKELARIRHKVKGGWRLNGPEWDIADSALTQVEPVTVKDNGTCDNCGEDLNTWDRFCPYCGLPIMGHGSEWV